MRDDVEQIIRHDMRHSLHSIISFPEIMLQKENLSQRGIDFLNIIKDSGKRLMDMMDMSLAIVKMEKKTYQLNTNSLNIIKLITNIMLELGSLLKMKQVQVQVNFQGEPVEDNQQFLVRGDELLCHTMLCNLIKNAIESSPKEGRVRIDLENGDAAKIVIHNKGEVPKEIKDQFFDKYSTAEKKKGTGLGTYSAKLIVDTHQGKINMASSASKGTTITIELPV